MEIRNWKRRRSNSWRLDIRENSLIGEERERRRKRRMRRNNGINFRRGDSSFSAFGESDKHGSTWLTAFVVRAFSQV